MAKKAPHAPTNKRIQLLRKSGIFLLCGMVFVLLFMLAGCGPTAAVLDEVDYTPLDRDDWEVSTPQEQGLDPDLVAALYHNAGKLDTVYSVLVIKDGYLIAEKYFNEGSIDQQNNVQSVTKSFFSAWVGLAIDQGCLDSVDQKLVDFFPEYTSQIDDPRKMDITIEHLLQMRSGYPWEESNGELFARFFGGEGDWLPLIVDFPLITDPGTDFDYSNFSTYLLGAIVERACNVDLREFAEEHLFTPTNTSLGEMWLDNFDHYYINIHVTARDAARFGQLYLDDGVHNGEQIISADFIEASLANYSTPEQVSGPRIGPNYTRSGYGYQWWETTSGAHTYDTALGHGGQSIALLEQHNMVIVVTADPFFLIHNDRAWRYEKANLNLVGNFVASLPSE